MPDFVLALTMTGILFAVYKRFLLFVALVAGAGQLDAQRVGGEFAEFELSDLTRTEARSLADFAGRALLIEFFSDT